MDLSIPVGECFTLAFPTPIYHRQWPDDDFNARLRALILEKHAGDSAIQVAQVGGWHSKTDLLQWPDPVIGILRERMVSAIGEMVHLLTDGHPDAADPATPSSAWANIARSGNFHALHDHASSVFSGVYYVSLGQLDPTVDPVENAAFVVPDPRLGAGMIPAPGKPFGRMLRFHPKPGLMLLFPSWLPHMANPFHGEGERISVSFNVCQGGNKA